MLFILPLQKFLDRSDEPAIGLFINCRVYFLRQCFANYAGFAFTARFPGIVDQDFSSALQWQTDQIPGSNLASLVDTHQALLGLLEPVGRSPKRNIDVPF